MHDYQTACDSKMNMPINRRFDWSYLLLFPYVAAEYIPWVNAHMQFRFVAPFLLIWLGLAYTRRPEVQHWEKVKASFLYAVLLSVLYHTFGLVLQPFGYSDGLTGNDVFDIVRIIAPLLVLHLSVRNGRRRELGMLVSYWLLCMACTCVMTLRGGTEIENASRLITGAGKVGVDSTVVADAIDAGVAPYAHIYAIGLLIAPMLYCSGFMARPMKTLCVTLASLYVVTVYSANYSICVMAVALGCVLWLVTRVGGRPRRVRISGFVLVVCVVAIVAQPQLVSFMAKPLETFGAITESKQYQMKIATIVDTISGVSGTYATDRSELYWRSWRTFLSRPLVGTGLWHYESTQTSELGGHSLVFDLLGGAGVLGFGLFVLSLAYVMRYMWTISSVVLGFRWWPAVSLFMWPAIMVAFLNPLRGYVVYTDLFLLIPGMACLFKVPDSRVRR